MDQIFLVEAKSHKTKQTTTQEKGKKKKQLTNGMCTVCGGNWVCWLDCGDVLLYCVVAVVLNQQPDISIGFIGTRTTLSTGSYKQPRRSQFQSFIETERHCSIYIYIYIYIYISLATFNNKKISLTWFNVHFLIFLIH